MRAYRRIIARGMCVTLLAVQCASLAVSAGSTLDTYNQIVESQGQSSILDVDAIGTAMVPEGSQIPVFDEDAVTDYYVTEDGSTGDSVTGTTTETGATTGTGTTETGTTTGTGTTGGTTSTETAPVTYTVKNITFTSRYSATYDVYELSASDLYYVYTNVENGGIVSGTFYVDVPYNVTYTLEKDGLPMEYTRKDSISELGSYYFTFTKTDEANLVQYVSTFRFRIEEAVEVPQVEDSAPSSDFDWSSAYGDLVLGEDGVVSSGDTPATEPDWEALLNQSLTETEGLGDLDDGEGLENPDQDLTETEQPQTGAGTTGVDPLVCTYDPQAGFYVNTLLTESYFYSNVTNGMITTSGVTLKAGQGDIIYTVYRDGEQIDYVAGMTLTDTGSYLVYPSEAGTLYAAAYRSVMAPTFSFTIWNEGQLTRQGLLAVPENMVVTDLTCDGVAVDVADGASHIYLAQDGAYQLTLEGDDYTYTLNFTKDTVGPAFAVDTSASNTATVTYFEENISDCKLYDGAGALLSEGVWVYQVDGTGDYTLEVYDQAGNVTQQSFTVTYGLNTGAILAIVLVIALAAGGVLVVRRFRNKAVVR